MMTTDKPAGRFFAGLMKITTPLSKISAVFLKEFFALTGTVVAWVFLAMFSLLTGFFTFIVSDILETGQASVSMLQRRLKLGYARAARIVDEMEEKGIVGPFQGSKPRSILITKEQWEARKSGSAPMDFDDIDAYAVPEEMD